MPGDAVSAIDAVTDARDDAVDVVSADAVVSTGAGLSVDLSGDAADGIVVDVPGGAGIEIGLPFAQRADEAEVVDGAIVFDNNNGSTTTPLVHEDGSVQVLTTITDASAPSDYAYSLGLPEGVTASLRADGGVDLVDEAGDLVGVVDPAWALDANGAAVPTWYSLDGSTLTQHVDHAGAAFPVVADPSISFGWAIYVKYSKTDVKNMTTGLGGAVNDKAKFGFILCAKIPHWAAKAGCALVGTSYHTSIYNTFKRARANGQCVEIQLAYISYLPVVWKTYSC